MRIPVVEFAFPALDRIGEYKQHVLGHKPPCPSPLATKSRRTPAVSVRISGRSPNCSRRLYDYVIVGAGSSGWSPASRLSANPAMRVRLVGPDSCLSAGSDTCRAAKACCWAIPNIAGTAARRRPPPRPNRNVGSAARRHLSDGLGFGLRHRPSNCKWASLASRRRSRKRKRKMRAAVFHQVGKPLSVENVPEAFEALRWPSSQCKVLIRP